MTLPNVPNITPDIDLRRDDVINLLLAAIAMEEIGLSHILKAEGEKIESSLCKATSFDEIIKVNKNTEKVLQNVIKKEMLLQFKLNDILEIIEDEGKQKEPHIHEGCGDEPVEAENLMED
ncbi:hypothetical protein [Desertibacillus haloalkaliphilus]|uniref:hypothetical protein n=1 Tax=Desertibacillus haloalkaliphilus TaxID=1328930 RepID=UPI001C265D67|nr:hypothetical protein [Desertibacillus haloalkaliphilus]MBU8907600.1 hypothetical protein [Desertibacillus haloalkaliphilus]